MRARRAAAQARNPDAPKALRDGFLAAVALPSASIVAVYSAREDEMDPAPLAAALAAAGHRLCLPVVVGKDGPLLFRAYAPGDVLESGIWGIPQPSAVAPVVEPSTLLVPLLAFDRMGHRLGYGGGYYDRTLPLLRQRLPVRAIGLGYAAQEVPAVPVGPRDAPLDLIVTESATIRPGESRGKGS